MKRKKKKKKNNNKKTKKKKKKKSEKKDKGEEAQRTRRRSLNISGRGWWIDKMTVMPRDGGGSTVEWSGAFDRGDPGNDPPAELNDAAAVAAVTGIYEAGMGALVERFGAPGT